jgi:hypothetical protein
MPSILEVTVLVLSYFASNQQYKSRWLMASSTTETRLNTVNFNLKRLEVVGISMLHKNTSSVLDIKYKKNRQQFTFLSLHN